METKQLLSCAGALALALLLVALPAAAVDPGRITFVSNRDGNWEIYVMDADGSHQVRLTKGSSADFYPAWSPDGSTIAFESNRAGGGNYDIYAVRPNGVGLVRLTDSPSVDVDPAWSPDGTRIAYRTGQDDIWVMDVDGSDPVCLTPTSGSHESSPTWSPDGSRIAYANFTSSPSGSTAAIWTINANGTGQALLRSLGDFPGPYRLSWSPDGSRIAYDTGMMDGIHVMNADGSGNVGISLWEMMDRHPAWSPDGSDRVILAAGAGSDEQPAWGRTYVPAVPPSALPPTDTDADVLYDDVNGNGRKDFADVVLYFNQMSWIAANEPVGCFDYNANGRVDFADVVWLFNHL